MNKDFSTELHKILTSQPINKQIKNIDCLIDYYQQENCLIISTIIDQIKPNCYTVSPYSAIVEYAKDELFKLPPIQKHLSSILIKTLAICLKLGKSDQVQTLNNYMLSTNTFSTQFSKIDLKKLTKSAQTRYPQHAILIRSLNQKQHHSIIHTLKQHNWLAITTRQIYIIDDIKKAMKHTDYKRDRKLFNDQTRYQFIEPTPNTAHDFKHAEKLYNQLYIEKYSSCNVQFSAEYLQQLSQAQLLHLRLLFDTETKQSVGVIGLTEEDGVITVPVIGYDPNYAQKEGLYRRLVFYGLDFTEKSSKTNPNTELHMSAGAPTFKTTRGARPHLEYTYVYCHHLPYRQQILWRILSYLSTQYYAKLLQKLKL